MKLPLLYPVFVVLFIAYSVELFAQPASSKALQFNGTSNFVNCGTINMSGNSITLQGWMRPQSFKTALPNISSFIGTEQPGNQCMIRLGDAGLANNKVQFVLLIGSTYYKLHSNQTLTTNDWYHVAATYDGAQMKIYINGILDTLQNQTGNISSNSTFEIARSYDNVRIFHGDLDELSVFSSALSETTIREWMCKRITPSHPDYVQLLGYWSFDEGTGTTTADGSGNGNTGTLTSSPVWKNSGAPVGNESKYVYGTNFSLGLAHPQGDSLHISSTSGTFDGVHIYRVDSVPYVTAVPAPLQYLDSSRYWGVFTIMEADYDLDYYYGNNPAATGFDCNLAFGTRADGNAATWLATAPTGINYTGEVLSLSTSDRKEIILAVSGNGPHTFTFDVNEPLCNGDTTGNIGLTVTGGLSPYSYAWQTGSTSAQSGDVATGYVSVTVTDDNDCESIDSVFVDEPTPLAVQLSGSASLCKDTNTGTALAIPAGGVGSYSFLWSDGNGSTTQTAVQLFPGTYTVTITDGNGCTTTSSTMIGSIGPDPIPDLGNDTNVCEGVIFGLTAGGFGGPFSQFIWSTGTTSAINIVNGPGTYSVTVENAQGCSGSDTVVVNYVSPIQVDLGAPNQTASGSLVLDAGAGFLTYQWSNFAATQSITVTQSATYWVKVTDQNKCKSADTVSVVITAAGMATLGDDKVKLYPNPAGEFAQLSIADKALIGKPFVIMNVLGQVVSSHVFTLSNLINTSGFAPGMYVVVYDDADGMEQSVRFMKQ